MSEHVLNTPSAPPIATNKMTGTTQRHLHLSITTMWLLMLAGATVGLFLLSLTLGSVEMPLSEVIDILLGGEGLKATHPTIIWKYRFPRASTALLAGAALAISGLQMQTFFRNPLAGPFVLGISSGASLGVALVVLSAGTVTIGRVVLSSRIAASDYIIIIAATVGAAVVMSLVLLVSQLVDNTITLLIVGLMFGYLTGALVSLLMYFSVAEQVQSYINWTFGSFTGVTRTKLPIFTGAIFIGLLIAALSGKSLNTLLLGETYARSMGLNVQRTRIMVVVSTSILAGTVTAFCGPIGFLGIAVPHLCRALFNTADHRVLIPASALMGACLAMLAAIIADMPGTTLVLPLNAVTALIGAPIVVWVIVRRRGRHAFSS